MGEKILWGSVSQSGGLEDRVSISSFLYPPDLSKQLTLAVYECSPTTMDNFYVSQRRALTPFLLTTDLYVALRMEPNFMFLFIFWKCRTYKIKSLYYCTSPHICTMMVSKTIFSLKCNKILGIIRTQKQNNLRNQYKNSKEVNV